jgi:putative hydrolase of the HAD superfamily
MIKTIFFDFDGVLTTDKSGSYTTCKYIQGFIKDLSFEDILESYRKHHFDLLLGYVNHKDIWTDFCKSLGKLIPFDVLTNAFKSTPKNKKILELCNLLKKKFKLGVITDNSSDRFNVVKKEMNLCDVFIYYIVSGDIGSRKDNEINFKKALEMSNTKPNDCIFIDNNRVNLVVPNKLGFNTIYHDHEKNDINILINKLNKYGVSVP